MFHRIARRALDVRRPVRIGGARLAAACLLLGVLGLGGCAQQPQQLAAAGHPKEYFPESIYGRASQRVIAEGQPVPHGGGQYLVGKPYTIAGQTYYPTERRITQVGLASWYGDAFHGRLTANGEIYDRDSFTAAHPTMPLPSYARVTNLRNATSMIVRVNDRGPYHSNRVMDVSRRVADALDIRRYGTAKVKVEWVGRASLAGSDDAKLAATLRNDGPARLEGVEERIMVAAISAPARIAALGSFFPQPSATPPAAIGERPDRLEAYRAPRVAHREHAPTIVEREPEPSVRDRPRLVATAAPRKDRHGPANVQVVAKTEAHGRPEAAHVGMGRQDKGLRFARNELSIKAHDERGVRADRSVPALRHSSTMAQDRPMPTARPARLAAATPRNSRPASVHTTRSRDD